MEKRSSGFHIKVSTFTEGRVMVFETAVWLEITVT
jgi:hypothetical protein